MMMSLFSSFDPSTWTFALNWFSSLFPLIFFPLIFWYLPNWYMFFMILFKTLNNELNNTLMGSKSLGSSLIFMGLFMVIVLNNCIGLFHMYLQVLVI